MRSSLVVSTRMLVVFTDSPSSQNWKDRVTLFQMKMVLFLPSRRQCQLPQLPGPASQVLLLYLFPMYRYLSSSRNYLSSNFLLSRNLSSQFLLLLLPLLLPPRLLLSSQGLTRPMLYHQWLYLLHLCRRSRCHKPWQRDGLNEWTQAVDVFIIKMTSHGPLSGSILVLPLLLLLSLLPPLTWLNLV